MENTTERPDLRIRGEEAPAEAYVHTAEDLEESNRLTMDAKVRSGPSVRIDPATLPQPMTQAQVAAEFKRRRLLRNTIQVVTEGRELRTYRLKGGQFQRIPTPAEPLPAMLIGQVRTTARESKPRPSRRSSPRTNRAGPSGDDDSSEPDDLSRRALRGTA